MPVLKDFLKLYAIFTLVLSVLMNIIKYQIEEIIKDALKN